jgi:hypothetical protein
MRVWVVYTRTRTRIPDGYRILSNNVPTGRKFIPYPPLYRVIPVGYSGFGYPLPSLVARPRAVGRPKCLSAKASSICRADHTSFFASSAQLLLKKTADLYLFTNCPEPLLYVLRISCNGAAPLCEASENTVQSSLHASLSRFAPGSSRRAALVYALSQIFRRDR